MSWLKPVATLPRKVGRHRPGYFRWYYYANHERLKAYLAKWKRDQRRAA